MRDSGRYSWVQPAGVAGLALLLGGAYLLSGSVQDEVGRAAATLADGDLESVRDYIRSFGVWAPVVSLVLMIVQALAAPIPAFVVIFANGLAFGTGWGWALSLLGQTLAAALCFGLSRTLGRGPVSSLVGRFGLESADGWFARWGAHAVLITRLVPGMAFDTISYAAGLTRMSFPRFMVATVLGAAPTTLFYAYLGQRAPQYGWLLFGATILLTAAFTLPAFIRNRRAQTQAEPPRSSSWMTKRELLVASRLHLVVIALAGLLVYLLIGQLIAPGFTDYWGYLLVQAIVVTATLLGLNRATAATGGLSSVTCLVVVGAVYADTLGNAAGLYRNYAAYDKFVHAMGTAALAAACYELLVALRSWDAGWLRVIAAVSAAMFFASAWEVYEYGADLVFATYRHAGTLDTTYDLIFDAIGAIAMSVFLARRESASTASQVPTAEERMAGYARRQATTAPLHPSTIVER